MAQRRNFDHGRRKHPGRAASLPPPPSPIPRSMPKQYGAPFVLMENERKQTFHFQSGAWVDYGRSIAECRLDCQVKQLTQKVNNMTRYEIRPEIQG